MDINATFIGQIVVFLILLWFFNKFVVPPLAEANAARQKKIAEGLAAADRGQKDLDEAQARADAIVREARERANQIVDQANRRSNEVVEHAKSQATVEKERIVAAARTEVATESARARDELRREVGVLAVAGASKLLGREIDPRTHTQLLDGLADEIARG